MQSSRRWKSRNNCNSKQFWIHLVLLLLTPIVLLYFRALKLQQTEQGLSEIMDSPSQTSTEGYSSSPKYSVAHIGNSIQYYNDCPRVLEKMLLSTALGRVVDLNDPQRKNYVRSESCLRGGSTVPSLWEKGNGMGTKFASRPDSILQGDDGYDIGLPTVAELLQIQPSEDRYWEFIVINDHTQSPVRAERKNESKAAFKAHHFPAIAEGMEASKQENNKATTIIFVQTMAYKSPVKDSADLGTFDEFTEGLAKGYDEYVAVVNDFATARFPNQEPPLQATVAPLGRAYQIIRQENFDLWSTSMYANDDFHPSPHGTLLEACILYCVITGQKFALFDTAENESMEGWWERARYMQPLTYPNGDPQEPLPLPTRTEAIYLNDIAYRVYLERQEHEKQAGNNSKL